MTEAFRRLYLPPWRIDATLRDGVGPLSVPLVALARGIASALSAAGAP